VTKDALVRSQEPDTATALQIFRSAMLIHHTDDRFRTLLRSGEIKLVYYPVRGQEVLSAAVMASLRADDYLVTTYRGVHDQLAKGVPSDDLWAEFLGKRTGSCKGKGGPMHITHPERGVMVTTGIVGSGLPIANGLGLASQLEKNGRVTVCSFGDGASNIGAFHESLNMASLWKLPVIFLCQNNRYAEHTPYAGGTSAARIVDRGVGYGMEAVRVDGTDAFATYAAACVAVERARAGEGPTLLEAMSYRMLGHTAGSDPKTYVPAEFFAEAAENDPIPRLRERLIGLGVEATQLQAVEDEVLGEIDEAVRHAMASDYPDEDEVRIDVLAQEIAA
jgi:acetoin:2,6-dichlorophenolindophenol oxidoreductase subunit alpha